MAQCPVCGDSGAIEKIVEDCVHLDDGVSLTVFIPVLHCAECDTLYEMDTAEKVRTDAIRRHFGLLTGKEILEIREKFGGSRTNFSKIFGIGSASLERWENSTKIQNRAMDNYLRLLAFDENSHLVSTKFTNPNVFANRDVHRKDNVVQMDKFKEIRKSELASLKEKGRKFKLRA